MSSKFVLTLNPKLQILHPVVCSAQVIVNNMHTKCPWTFSVVKPSWHLRPHREELILVCGSYNEKLWCCDCWVYVIWAATYSLPIIVYIETEKLDSPWEGISEVSGRKAQVSDQEVPQFPPVDYHPGIHFNDIITSLITWNIKILRNCRPLPNILFTPKTREVT